MRDNETWDAIPEELLMDCAQLTKANSIEGNKKDNITVIYTPWSNLKKDGSMATGQVGFKDNKKVKRVYVSARENAIVNRLNKTKVEKHPDLRQEKEDRERELRKVERIAQQEKVSSIGNSARMWTCKANEYVVKQKREDARLAEERQQLKWQKEHMYDDVHTEDQMVSNQDRDEGYLSDFM
jgi:hypothetical protein